MELGAGLGAARGGLLAYHTHYLSIPFILGFVRCGIERNRVRSLRVLELQVKVEVRYSGEGVSALRSGEYSGTWESRQNDTNTNPSWISNFLVLWSQLP